MTKMPRRRKVLTVVPEVESENDEHNGELSDMQNSTMQHGPMYTIMSNAQLNETFHNKYVKEMQQLYDKMDHDAFLYTFIKMVKSAMEAEETNEYAHTTLMFCAKYVCSYDREDTHPVLLSIFEWLLSTISHNPHIRFRLCQFVNMILNALGVEAALDDCICDSIMSYMINRLRDLNPNVRLQAILALQRLQIPDNPDDIVVKTYQFHLSSDPSSKVRQAVITSMGRNYNTIPYILERLWDVDEKVRRHTYLHMSSYPARSYKVVQRLTFLEQGLNDRSEMVRKVVTSVMLPQWFESYNKDVIALVSALKMDANEAEIDRFRKITKVALREIFKRQKMEDVIKNLPIEEEQEGEFIKCIPIDKLSIENTLFWLCLIEYLQTEMADEIDLIIPELSVFCSYVLKYCESCKFDMDKWQKMEYQYILLTLMEIISTFDLGDEIGRENLKKLLRNLLKNYDTDEHTVEVIVRCAENLLTEQEERLQFFVEIIKEIYDVKLLGNDFSNDRELLGELLEKHPDKSLKLKLSSLKVKILELEEQEMNFVERKDYVNAQKIADERNACSEEYASLLQPVLNQISNSESSETIKSFSTTFQQTKKITTETIIKCLQISFHMVVSKKVKSLTPNVCELYKDFIRRHIESSQLAIRDWALKCGTAYSMLYDQLSKDVYAELYSQFFKNHNIKIWKTSIDCMFELLDRYGLPHFELEDKQNRNRKPGRQLYNTLEFLDAEDEPSSTSAYGVDVIFMMSHFLDTCDDVLIISALVNGFCRLVLHGHIRNDDIVEKLILKYFNPATESEINQILGVFFDNLIAKKKQEYLQPCLLPTIQTILSAPYDSPLHEIKPETVLRFVIDATQPIFCSSGLNIHNTMALSFMQEMQNNISNKDLLRILSKDIITLELTVADDAPLRNDLRACCDKLLQAELDPKTAKNIQDFKGIMEGKVQTCARPTTGEGSDEEHYASEEETGNTNKTATEEEDVRTCDQSEPVAQNKDTEKENEVEEVIEIQKQNTEPIEHSESEKESTIQDGTDASDTNTQPSTEISTPCRTNDEENIIKTPTTFGKDNTTTMRYLRKSLNAQRASTDDGPTRPPKIRIQARSPSKRFDSNSKVGKNDKNQNRHYQQKVKIIQSQNRTKDQRGKVNDKKVKQKSNTQKGENKSKETHDGDESTSNNESDEENNLDEINEIPASPKVASQSVRRNRERIGTKTNPRTANNEKLLNGNHIRKEYSKTRRRLSMSASPTPSSSASGDSELSLPLRKQSKQSNDISVSETPEKELQKNKNETTPAKSKEIVVKRNENKNSKQIHLTNSVEKRIKKSKNPVLKLQRFQTQSAGRTTRSIAKKEFQLNQVMTRKRLSLDKLSTDLASSKSPSPSKRNQRRSDYNVDNSKKTQKQNKINGALRNILDNSNKPVQKDNKENENMNKSSEKQKRVINDSNRTPNLERNTVSIPTISSKQILPEQLKTPVRSESKRNAKSAKSAVKAIKDNSTSQQRSLRKRPT